MSTRKITKKIPLEISRRVREIRQIRGMTQKALAEACDLTPQAITQLEAGKRLVSVTTLMALAKTLEISVDAILGLPTSRRKGLSCDSGSLALAERVARLPKEQQEEVQDYLDFVWEKRVRKKAGKKK